MMPASRANGPGLRAVIWTQGCSLGCPGCYNPETHPFRGGVKVAVTALVDWIRELAEPIEGVTISGGEPLQQLSGVCALLQRLRTETDLSTVLFSGFTWDEIVALPRSQELFTAVDVLIAGRFDQRRRLGAGLRGSANQTVHFLTARYSPADLEVVPVGEIVLTSDGTVVSSGVDPVDLRGQRGLPA